MNTANWKDIVELAGIAAIVASLIFVGIELRQSQRIAYAEQEGAQIADFLVRDELISSKANLIIKLNQGEELSDVEEIEAERLILSIYSMSFFTNQRAFYLDHPGVGVPEQSLAILLYQNPGLRTLWVRTEIENRRLRNILAKETELAGGERYGLFREKVARHLAVLDRAQ